MFEDGPESPERSRKDAVRTMKRRINPEHK